MLTPKRHSTGSPALSWEVKYSTQGPETRILVLVTDGLWVEGDGCMDGWMADGWWMDGW